MEHHYQDSYNVAFTVPASNRGHHYTLFYARSVTNQKIEEMLKVYFQFMESMIHKDQNNRHMLGYSEITFKKHGDKSVLLWGDITYFKKQVNDFMSLNFPEEIDLTRTLSHVDLQGKHDTVLYPSFNMKQINLKKVKC
jgi:hypothetical protein